MRENLWWRKGRVVVEDVVVEEEDVVEGTRRFGRGKIGRVEMREEGEEVGGEGYCCWGG